MPVCLGEEFFVPGELISGMFVTGGLVLGRYPFHQLVQFDIPAKDAEGNDSPQRMAQFEYLPFTASSTKTGGFYRLQHKTVEPLPDGWTEIEPYQGLGLFPNGIVVLRKTGQPRAAAA